MKSSLLLWRWTGQVPFTVRIIPVLQDNYSYLVTEDISQASMVVDPSEDGPIIQAIKENNLHHKLQAVVTTHHHWDHIAGMEGLKQCFPSVPVYGFSDSRNPHTNHPLVHGETFSLGKLTIRALHVPGHTISSVSYVVETTGSSNETGDKKHSLPIAIFTGDTLFLGGCGKFFEGTAQDMYQSLYERIDTALLDTTFIFPGHEYTRNNLMFAMEVEPSNKAISKRLATLNDKHQVITVPGTLGEEKVTNPFLRCHRSKELQSFFGKDDNPMQLLKKLRDYKDKWGGSKSK